MIVRLARGAGFFGPLQAVSDEEVPVRWNRFGRCAGGIEVDAERASGAAREAHGMIHAAAACADVLLSIRQYFHERPEFGLDALNPKQGKGRGDNHSRRGTESGGCGQVARESSVEA